MVVPGKNKSMVVPGKKEKRVLCRMRLIPELLVQNINISKRFYVDVLEFEVTFERPQEGFVYFSREGVDLMCEELSAPGRRWLTGEMQVPFGRGINFQWEVSDVDALYRQVSRLSPTSIYLPIEDKSYQTAKREVFQRQFIAQDPDGYLFRFCSEQTNLKSER